MVSTRYQETRHLHCTLEGMLLLSRGWDYFFHTSPCSHCLLVVLNVPSKSC